MIALIAIHPVIRSLADYNEHLNYIYLTLYAGITRIVFKRIIKNGSEEPFQADDKPCHQLGRLLRKSADKTNRGESCTEYCEPRFVLSEKI